MTASERLDRACDPEASSALCSAEPELTAAAVAAAAAAASFSAAGESEISFQLRGRGRGAEIHEEGEYRKI